MSKNCCCPPPSGLTFDTFCCNPLLFTDFITLYGDNMADHAEVSPGDWISLKQSRGKNATYEYDCTFFCASVDCNCCCDTCSGNNLFTNNNTSTATNKSAFNANDIFDKNNSEGFIRKKGKSRPLKSNTIVSNNTFFSGNRLAASRFKKLNPSVIPDYKNFGSTQYYYIVNNNSVDIAFNQSGNAPEINYDNTVELNIQNQILSGNYVLGSTLSTNNPVQFDDRFSLYVSANLSTPPGFGVFTGDWENQGCEIQCNTAYCCAGDVCPPDCCNECCCAHKEIIGVKSYDPMYFAYKYSGCHFIWHPREMFFGKDPYAPQCLNTFTYAQSQCSDSPNPSYKKSVASCGVMSASRVFQGAASAAYPIDQCMSPWADRFDGVGPLINVWPCHCTTHPHIHGGALDSALCQFNISTTPGQLGYVPQFRAFFPPMKVDELDCCWCSSFTVPNFASHTDIISIKTSCGRIYPAANGWGKTPSVYDPCRPGFSCYWMPGQDPAFLVGNPGYNTECFKHGISPYLLRVSKTQFKSGYEIFAHGNGEKYNFGPDIVCTSIDINDLTRDYKFRFKKIPVSQTTLKEQCIGFVQLEHHFECCAFRCNTGIATKDPGLIINSCGAGIPPFESEGYAGSFKPEGTSTCGVGIRARWTPYYYSSNLWQIKRGVPRRVMYAGSGIPIFKFDLINMENWSFKNTVDGEYFFAEEFLEHWYRYYYGLITFSGRGCTGVNARGEPLEWDYTHYMNSHRYVVYWLEKMVEAGILRIKDHAIDIAKEVNDIIGAGSFVQTPEGGEIITIPPDVAVECGGVSGYIDLVDFFGVNPGTKTITPKIIKEKLLNTSGLYTYDGPGTDTGSNNTSMRLFLPRRARLPIGPLDTTIYAWGCDGYSPEEQIEGCTGCTGFYSIDGITCCLPGITCPSYVLSGPDGATGLSINVPEVLNTKEGIYSDISPIKVICGLAGTFVVDRTGKLAIFGGWPLGGDYEPSPSSSRVDPFTGQIVEVNSRVDMHPTSIVDIPWYLSLFSVLGPDGDILSDDEIADGNILDVVFNPNFAVALVDFKKKGLGSRCLGGLPGNVPWKTAWEWYEWDPGYQTVNTNGSNLSLRFLYPPQGDVFWEPVCVLNEPWGTSPGAQQTTDEPLPDWMFTAYNGARSAYSSNSRIPAYRLKSWGSKGISYGTFSLSYEDAQVINYGWPHFSGTNTCVRGDIVTKNPWNCVCNEFGSANSNYPPFFNGFRGFDPLINPQNLRYPGTNSWFIWTKIAAGAKHFAAIDDFGGVFITALSSNEENQSAKGKPLPYFNPQRRESWPQQGFSDPRFYPPDYCGLESRFNYYNHIPRPGFISESDWSQDFYNSVTSRYSPWLNCNGACEAIINVDTGSSQTTCTQVDFGSRDNRSEADIPKQDKCYNNTDIGGTNQQLISPCVMPFKRDGACDVDSPYPSPRIYDLTTWMMGSLCQRMMSDNSIENQTQAGTGESVETLNMGQCTHSFRVTQQNYNSFQPRYTDIAAGQFNTMLLTNENRIEIYGTYYQIDENGQKIGKGISCYVPTMVSAKQGTWGLTYGCPVYCPGITYEIDLGSGITEYIATSGVTHHPIISATYKQPKEQDNFAFLRSSADYSLAITEGNEIYVWGDASMVPGGYCQGTYYPGLSAEKAITIKDLDLELASFLATVPNTNIKIREVASGIHSFYIHYEIKTANSSYSSFRTCSYTRYGRTDFGGVIPDEIQNKELVSLSAGNGFAVGIVAGGQGPQEWPSDGFAPETLKYQYKNFDNLPLYFKRDAFFHAVPGNWDYSKWLWGDVCCFSITNPDHPVLQQDTCSALAYNLYRDKNGKSLPSSLPDNDPARFNPLKSYSGHPEHLWLRPDIRRTTAHAIIDIGELRDRNGQLACDYTEIDGAKPFFGGSSTVGDLAGDFGFCYQNLGPCWSPSTPQSPLYKTRSKKKWNKCSTNPCASDQTKVVTSVCSDKFGAYICSGANTPAQISYSATKDVFQSKYVQYSYQRYGASKCVAYDYHTIDYFKYSQRNFYLGYDSENDIWQIYNSPDIFRETLTNKPVLTDTCCYLNPDPDTCPSRNPDEWLCPGATTTIDYKNCGWGGGVTTWSPSGCSGSTHWSSLSSYPMPGPNYYRQDYNNIPPHYPTPPSIGFALWLSELPGSGSNGSSECTDPNLGCYATVSREHAIERFAGPGGLGFNTKYLSCGDQGEDALGLEGNVYTYIPIVESTDSPLTMLKGVQSNINPIIPPTEDTNYKNIGFREVLNNPSLTNINYEQIFNDEPTKAFFKFRSGTPGTVLLNNHGFTVGSQIIFESAPLIGNGLTGEGGIIKGVKIKINPDDPEDPSTYLQLETPYYVCTKNLYEDSFSISYTREEAFGGIGITFYTANLQGVTGSNIIVNSNWFHLFDIIPSNYNGINGITAGTTPCFSGTNNGDCYRVIPPNNEASIDGNHVLLVVGQINPQDPPNIIAIFGNPYLCILTDCCGE